MKLRVLGLVAIPLLLGLTVYSVRSGDLTRWSAVVFGFNPVIECPSRLELGEQELGTEALARFTIANRGSGELVIDRVRTNCRAYAAKST